MEIWKKLKRVKQLCLHAVLRAQWGQTCVGLGGMISGYKSICNLSFLSAR